MWVAYIVLINRRTDDPINFRYGIESRTQSMDGSLFTDAQLIRTPNDESTDRYIPSTWAETLTRPLKLAWEALPNYWRATNPSDQAASRPFTESRTAQTTQNANSWMSHAQSAPVDTQETFLSAQPWLGSRLYRYFFPRSTQTLPRAFGDLSPATLESTLAALSGRNDLWRLSNHRDAEDATIDPAVLNAIPAALPPFVPSSGMESGILSSSYQRGLTPMSILDQMGRSTINRRQNSGSLSRGGTF